MKMQHQVRTLLARKRYRIWQQARMARIAEELAAKDAAARQEMMENELKAKIAELTESLENYTSQFGMLTTQCKRLGNDLKKAKPSSAKGAYFKKVTLSSTMGPGLAIDPASLAM